MWWTDRETDRQTDKMAVTYTAFTQMLSAIKVIIHYGMVRSDLHLCESQRVTVVFPVIPHNAIDPQRRVADIVIATIEIGMMTCFVPPATFEQHCTCVWRRVVVLVSSAEVLSFMPTQWITCRRYIQFTGLFHNLHWWVCECDIRKLADRIITICRNCEVSYKKVSIHTASGMNG